MSQVNHNYSYITEVDGLTVWERLRVIRNFIKDRRKALQLARLGKLKRIESYKTMTPLEIEEAEIMAEDEDDLIQDCVDELDFLTKFEARLAVEAEKERIEGKSDREMYELNYPKEAIARLALEVQASVLTIGNVSHNIMQRILRNPDAAQQLVAMGLMSEAVLHALPITKSEGLLAIEAMTGDSNVSSV